jgi:hypothetical protein
MIQDTLTTGFSRERRFRPRRKLLASATYRERGRSRSSIEVTDLSSTGCRMRLQGALVSGEHGWVTLPSLGPWSCSIAWHADREVGLSFDRPLHSAVAEMITDRHQKRS